MYYKSRKISTHLLTLSLSFVRLLLMKKITRPWQATTLAILGGTKLVLLLIILFTLLLAQDWLGMWLSQFNPELIVVMAIKPIIFLPLILFILVLHFIVRALWIGRLWAPMFLTFIHGISLVLMGLWMLGDARWAIPFAITLFILALDIECWINPFFKKE